MKNFTQITTYMKNKRLIAVFFVGILIVSFFSIYNSMANGNVKVDQAVEQNLKESLYLTMDTGCTIKIGMFADAAPNHIARIKELVKSGYYDGVEFHRVIDGFMAQAGGKNGNPNHSSGIKVKQEFNSISHTRGIVSMARASDPNSADAQFFIVTHDSRFLDQQYTVWGFVAEGMDCVDKIKKGDQSNNGMVDKPSKIISAKIAYDSELEEAKNSQK